MRGSVCGLLPAEDLQALVDALHARGHAVIAPVVDGGVLTLGEVATADAIAAGWTAEQGPGRYRLTRRTDSLRFATGPTALPWKRFLHPPETLLFRARRDGAGFAVTETPPAPQPQALFGLLPCDLAAVARLDQAMAGDALYQARRRATLLIAVTCAEAAATCFCTSLGTGPAVTAPCDLALTELAGRGLLVEAHSAAGEAIAAALPLAAADEPGFAERDAIAARTADAQTRSLPADVAGVLRRAVEHPRWQAVAERCLTCGNCTSQCPTCFCSTVEDATSLDGATAERRRMWDGCFSLEFSYVVGGPVRQSAAARYRQWITHKLSTWHDQFGASGCVGCGRCITWCPVGIDITEEAAILAAAEAREAAP